MKSALAALLCICTVSNAHARLGESPKQIFDRYSGRLLWTYQVTGAKALPEYCFLRDGYMPAFMFQPKATISRVGLIICYQTDEMDQIQVYYDRVTTNSVAEIFYPRLPYHVDWDGISRLNPKQEYERNANNQHLEKMAMLIGPKAANASDLELCPFHKRTFFSKATANVVFCYGAGTFGVADLGHSSTCFQEYTKQINSAVGDLNKARKY
jgi:hypothetical protein